MFDDEFKILKTEKRIQKIHKKKMGKTYARINQ